MSPANIYSKFLCLNVELNNNIITPKILQIHHSEADIFLHTAQPYFRTE